MGSRSSCPRPLCNYDAVRLIFDWGEESDDDDDDDDDDEEIEDEIVEQFIRTFNNGNYDALIDAKLCKDRGVICRFGPCRRHTISPTIGEKGIELDWRK